MYSDTNNRAPANMKEFCGYIEHDAQKLAQAIRDNYYTVEYKIRDPRSKAILAYEREDDEDGKRWVVSGDASAKKMSEGELQRALEGRE
jgi:DNA-dependent RNA polymerase auxiliary subunit epsilon